MSKLVLPGDRELQIPLVDVGIVTAQFNSHLTEQLEKAAYEVFEKSEFVNYVKCVQVPGALEIPLAAQWLLEKERCVGVLGLGVVIRGETTHYDYVCAGAERGCSQLQLNTGKPVAFGVLTVENQQQAEDRITGKKGNKGTHCAEALLDMIKLYHQVSR